MIDVTTSTVWYEDRLVGTISLKNQSVAFEYADSWINKGFSISPFSLPLEKRLFIAPKEPFGGIFGVFDDLLPDGWGRLLTDRYLKSRGIDPYSINYVTRLTLLSNDGMGALHFLPQQMEENDNGSNLDFDEIKSACDEILKDRECNDIDHIFRMAGSSGGARPKAYIKLKGEPWIVKFPSSYDSLPIGEEEFKYNRAASNCDIETSETMMLPSKVTTGYFTTKRFDRKDGNRIHMVSIGGLLEASHRYPSLDYDHIFKVSQILSKDTSELYRVFRLMCFNEFAHNWDDHAKNFAFLFDEEMGWRLSPAYDLTHSSSFGGEHATTVNGKGKNIKDEDLIATGRRFSLQEKKMKSILEKTKKVVYEELSEYLGK